uniref:Uncharacterized protein n=1 Tax=Rhizophora mucronata TaxID=61149 RepID=A0A2P2MZT6_RHIMU
MELHSFFSRSLKYLLAMSSFRCFYHIHCALLRIWGYSSVQW